MGIKQLYNDNLRKLPNEYGDFFLMDQWLHHPMNVKKSNFTSYIYTLFLDHFCVLIVKIRY